MIALMISAVDVCALTPNTRATTPAACGEAIDVPLRVAVPVSPVYPAPLERGDAAGLPQSGLPAGPAGRWFRFGRMLLRDRHPPPRNCLRIRNPRTGSRMWAKNRCVVRACPCPRYAPFMTVILSGPSGGG